MVTKRSGSSEPLDQIADNNVKKRRTNSGSPGNILALSLQDLSELPSDTLVSYIVELQQAYKDVSTKLEAAKRELDHEVTSKGNAAGADMSKEQIRAKANKLADMMGSEIMKQMKWQPSCKTTGKRWVYSAMVPSVKVFFKLFKFGEEKKAWKQKKTSLEAFEAITGELRASVLQSPSEGIRDSRLSKWLIVLQIRYGYLGVTSKDITNRWNEEDLSFSVSGRYGLV
ncbi:hypothetical protein MMC17_007058 [Xylographa soralifera]|nr:hypothetical protein [Xylographa soralifera]